MKLSLTMQVLLFLVACMIHAAIKDNEIGLYLNNKAMYHHLADLCENWNTVGDVYNVRDGHHTPKNGNT